MKIQIKCNACNKNILTLEMNEIDQAYLDQTYTYVDDQSGNRLGAITCDCGCNVMPSIGDNTTIIETNNEGE